MQLVGQAILSKLKSKNRGNTRLIRAIDQFVSDLEHLKISSPEDLERINARLEKVHSDGFYFADIHVHRLLLMIKIGKNEAKIVWAGNHGEYERIFKNNKDSIEKWLRNNEMIF